MHIPFVDLKANYQSIKAEIDTVIKDVIDHTAFIKGKHCEQFEHNWAKACGTNFAIGTSNGTTSLELILRAYNISHGDEVIVPSHTFIATAEAVCAVGATPVFADCLADTGLIDAESVRKQITAKTKAVMIVDLYGQTADYDAVKAVIGDRDIKIIQDSAQAHFARYKGQIVGSYCECVSFSFYPGKNLGAFGDAGAVVTSNPELAKKIKMLSDHGRTNKYEHELVGFNYRMDGLQGAVLGVKLNHLQNWVDRRHQIAKLYNSLLTKKVKPIVEAEGNTAVYHLYVIRCEHREKLGNFLKEHQIETGIHYPLPLHLQPAFKSLGYKKGDFPVTEKLADEIFSLPIYPEMSDEMVKFVAGLVNEFYES